MFLLPAESVCVKDEARLRGEDLLCCAALLGKHEECVVE